MTADGIIDNEYVIPIVDTAPIYKADENCMFACSQCWLCSIFRL